MASGCERRRRKRSRQIAEVRQALITDMKTQVDEHRRHATAKLRPPGLAKAEAERAEAEKARAVAIRERAPWLSELKSDIGALQRQRLAAKTRRTVSIP